MNRLFLFVLLFFLPLAAKELDQDDLINATASLLHCLSEQELALTDYEGSIPVSEEAVSALWNKVLESPSPIFAKAFSEYQQAQNCFAQKDFQSVQAYLKKASDLLSDEWIELIDRDKPVIKTISGSPYKVMEPYLIPSRHPMTAKLEAIFSNNRVTLNKETFQQAGFQLLKHHRSMAYITVARHPNMPGYLVKAYMDNQLQTKKGFPSWQWLSYRCEGAKRIRDIIEKKKFKHFVVASKWIYLLPDKPSPPSSEEYVQHLAVLLVTDMNITDNGLNKHAWKNKITEEHLNELYYIISHAGGSSYRADNIPYTVTGKFAFIDTEYPHRQPNFRIVRKFLNNKMAKYWDSLVASASDSKE